MRGYYVENENFPKTVHPPIFALPICEQNPICGRCEDALYLLIFYFKKPRIL